jgi:hypothetical protein
MRGSKAWLGSVWRDVFERLANSIRRFRHYGVAAVFIVVFGLI